MLKIIGSAMVVGAPLSHVSAASAALSMQLRGMQLLFTNLIEHAPRPEACSLAACSGCTQETVTDTGTVPAAGAVVAS
jgi:hypothetical protein